MIKDKYAFILGRGDLAKSLIESAEKQNIDFVVAGIKGMSQKSLIPSNKSFWFYIGQVEDFLSQLRKHKVTKVILAGNITRPALHALKVDSLGSQIISTYLKNVQGDNSLLEMVIKVIESYGFKVVGFQEIDPSLISHSGILTNNHQLVHEYQEDIDKGFEIAKKISNFDIGQSIIYQQNRVMSIEAAEGTAKMILRSKKLIKKKGKKALLIKIKKHNQDIRVDLPTIGDKTIKQAKKVGLQGIVIEKKFTVILNYEKTINLANKYGIFVIAI